MRSTSTQQDDTKNSGAFAQHFIDTLHRKLHDPSLLQAFPPPPPPEIFKHNDKNPPTHGPSFLEEAANFSEVWGSERHPFSAPPGSYKLLSSDYAWLDAPRAPARREVNNATAAGSGGAGANKSEGGPPGAPHGEQLPEPPLAMQQTRFLSHARLVLIKLKQQLEELCVGAVRTMEAAVMPSPLAGAGDPLGHAGLSSAASLAAPSTIAGLRGVTSRSLAAATSLGDMASMAPASMASGFMGGGGRLAPGLADELAASVRFKLAAAFEDCLSDLMDQLWGVMQYAGSKHALVERLAEAMKQREAELEATAAKYREEAASKLRSLRRQKEEIEAAAEKDRTELRAAATAANARSDVLEREMSALRTAVETERSQISARLDAQRAEFEAALQARDEALEAVRADSVARLEELRVMNVSLQQQLQQKQAELAKLTARTTDQADILALALARRDGTSKELDVLMSQLEDFKRFFQMHAALPLTEWLNSLREGDTPLTPLIGGPLALEFGTGRAFMAAARSEGLRAVQEELKRQLPAELPWPEDGWPPPDGEGAGEGAGGRNRNSSLTDLSSGGFPPTLPATWFRFVRAPLGHVMDGPQLMAHLAELARAKWEADKEARLQGQQPPDLHMFVYKHALNEHSSAMDADEAVICLVQSLKAHAPRMPRAAIWMQLLQLGNPVLPLDACGYYLEVFHALITPPPAPSSSSSLSSSSASRVPHNVVDRAACVVWVPPPRWKAVLTGAPSAVFDPERKMALLRQAAAVRVDTNRGSKTFGMTEGDALMAVLMGVWLSQRQASVNELSAAWSAVEPVGGGVLAVHMDVSQLAGVAVSALGPDALPQDRTSLLDLYFNTVAAARQAQAAARMRWSGLNVSALATALASAELLPPRPLSRRGNPSAARLAVASGHLLRIADFQVEDMRAAPAFRMQPTFDAMEAALGRVRDLLVLCAQDAPVSVRQQAEQERRVQAGWATLEGATEAVLAAMEAWRVYDNGVREQVVKAAVDAALARAAGGEGGETRRTTPRLSSMRHRSSRVQRTSGLSGGPDEPLPNGRGSSSGLPPTASGEAASPLNSTPTSHRLSGGGAAALAILSARAGGLSGRASARFSVGPSPRPASGRRGGAGRPQSGAWPRDLRAALASGRWSSDDDEEILSVGDESIGMPPTLQLRGRSARARSAHAATAPGDLSTPRNSGGPDDGGGGGDGGSARGSELSGGAPAAAGALSDGDDGEDVDPALDPNSPPEVRLAALESKYGKLRSRYGQTMRALNAAYTNANAVGDLGSGLPAREVMAQLDPAAKLRLVAELLAELHQEVERGVWPHLDNTVMAAIAGQQVPQPGQTLPASPASAALAGGSLPGSGRRLSAQPTPSGGGGGLMFPLTVRPLSAFATPRGVGPGTPGSGGRPLSAAALTRTQSRAGAEASTTSSSWIASGVGGSTGPGELLAGGDPGCGGIPMAEVQEMAGRLHAHAGHVGQVMAAAALETAALAAALDDLAGWRTRSPSFAVRRGTSPAMIPAAAGTEAAGGAHGGQGQGGLGGAEGSPGAGPGRTPVSTGGDSIAGGVSFGEVPLSPFSLMPAFNAAAAAGSGGGGGYSGNPLQRSLTTPRSSGLVPPLPLAALQYGGGGDHYLTTFSVSGRSSSPAGSYSGGAGEVWDPVTVSSSGSAGAGGAGSGSAAGAAEAAVQAYPWGDETPYDSDPRDTVYLDALRALHLAAEAQAAGEVSAEAVMGAVQEVVRLMGGQPQVQGDGQVIEFFPRRIPKDWRHPVLRSSLTRLYIYVVGGLVQQHERDRLLAEAAADVDERLARLAAAADDLERRAEGLRGLQMTLGAQLATLAAAVAHGSVLMDRITKLEALGGDLKARVVDAQPSEKVNLLQLASPPTPSTPPQAGAVVATASPARAQVKGLPGMPPKPAVPKGRAGPSRLSNGSEAVSPAAAGPATATASTAVPAASAPAPASASSPTAAAAAVAPAVAAAPLPSPPLSAPAVRASEGVLVPVAAAPTSPVPGVLRAPAVPASKVAVFGVEDWEAVQAVAAALATAVAGLREAATQLADLAQMGAKAEGLKEGRGTATSPAGQPVLPSPKLPTGDRILSVNVSVVPAAGSATSTAASSKQTPAPADTHVPPAPSPHGSAQQPQQPISFVIDFDPPSGTPTLLATQSDGKRSSTAVIAAAITVAGGGLPQYPDIDTPAVTPEASSAALSRPSGGAAHGITVHMALRRAQAVTGDTGDVEADPGALPPGDALIHLSDTLLRRSAMAAMRRHMGSSGGGGGSRPMGLSGQGGQAVDALGPVPVHYERRPMTGRAFVEGVMTQARREQLEKLYGAAGTMPRGGLPELEGLMRMDGHEAALMEQRALTLAGPEPHPTTALDALVQQNIEQAAAASAAATTAVADALSAAAAAAAARGPGARSRSPGRGRGYGTGAESARQGGSGSATGSAAGSAAATSRQGGGSRRAPARGPAAVHSRLASGLTGTKISTLPPMAPAAADGSEGEGAKWPAGPHLGYYPGMQVDAAGRVMDWRLPVLSSLPAPNPLHRSPGKSGEKAPAVQPQQQGR